MCQEQKDHNADTMLKMYIAVWPLKLVPKKSKNGPTKPAANIITRLHEMLLARMWPFNLAYCVSHLQSLTTPSQPILLH